MGSSLMSRLDLSKPLRIRRKSFSNIKWSAFRSHIQRFLVHGKIIPNLVKFIGKQQMKSMSWLFHIHTANSTNSVMRQKWNCALWQHKSWPSVHISWQKYVSHGMSMKCHDRHFVMDGYTNTCNIIVNLFLKNYLSLVNGNQVLERVNTEVNIWGVRLGFLQLVLVSDIQGNLLTKHTLFRIL